jgi:hypothetical protein
MYLDGSIMIASQKFGEPAVSVSARAHANVHSLLPLASNEVAALMGLKGVNP